MVKRFTDFQDYIELIRLEIRGFKDLSLINARMFIPLFI